MPDTTERFWEALAELADLASTVSPTPYDIDRFVEDRAAILRKYSITKREWEAFSSSEEYYSTLFHELSHSTGHASRLKRFPVETVLTPFGSPDYSFEELIAEMGACYVLSECGVFETVKENSAAYVDHWKKQIADDPGAFIRACGKGQKAADYILGEYQGEATGETEEHAVA